MYFLTELLLFTSRGSGVLWRTIFETPVYSLCTKILLESDQTQLDQLL